MCPKRQMRQGLNRTKIWTRLGIQLKWAKMGCGRKETEVWVNELHIIAMGVDYSNENNSHWRGIVLNLPL